MIVDFRKILLLPGQVYVGLSSIKTSDDVLLPRRKEDMPRNAHKFYPLQISIKTRISQNAVDFVEERY